MGNQEREINIIKYPDIKITALIPTYNCEKTIRATIESISWCDEIIVVDSYSSDNTLKIVHEYDIRIVQNEYINSSSQKNWALTYCNYDWILQIDSDEILEDNTENIIRESIHNADDSIDCFRLARKNHVLGKWIRYGGFYPDWEYRLFRKTSGKWNEREVHAKVIVNGKTNDLNIHIIHHGMPNISKQLGNINRYSRYEADEMIKKGVNFKFFKWIIGPILIFFKRYLLQLGFLDGWRGFFMAIYTSFYFFVSYTKLLEARLLRLEKSPH